jgi:lipoic acid synthetase
MSNRTLPDWIRKTIPDPGAVRRLEGMMRTASLNTVCESARCPNLGECWSHKTATFMILGDTCTRNCGFCAIKVGKPPAADPEEPARVAEAAREMGLRHVVVTSVTRDDMPDQGAGQFADTIEALRQAIPGVIVEVLTPDFQGKRWLIKVVTDARPEIFNHNIETVERLSPEVRPQARYHRSLEVLQDARRLGEGIYTKSGIMLGLGETRDEVLTALHDLRQAGVDAVTIGQYLRPTAHHLPVREYVRPEAFAEYKRLGEAMGFLFVASGPFVRSSHNAIEFSRKVMADRLAAMEATPSPAEAP